MFVCWRESVRDAFPLFCVGESVSVSGALTMVIAFVFCPLIVEFSLRVSWLVVNHGKRGPAVSSTFFLWECVLFFACVFKVMRVKERLVRMSALTLLKLTPHIAFDLLFLKLSFAFFLT